MSRTLAFYTLAIMNAASVFGRTIPNLLADHFGKFNVFVPICFMTGVLIWAMFGIANTGGVIVFSILYGFASGACEYSFTFFLHLFHDGHCSAIAIRKDAN